MAFRLALAYHATDSGELPFFFTRLANPWARPINTFSRAWHSPLQNARQLSGLSLRHGWDLLNMVQKVLMGDVPDLCRAASVVRNAHLSALQEQRWLGGNIVSQQKDIRMGIGGQGGKPRRI